MATKDMTALLALTLLAVAGLPTWAGCEKHPWYQSEPENIRRLLDAAPAHEFEVLPIQDGGVHEAIELLKSKPFVVISPTVAARLTGARHFVSQPEESRGPIVLFRALRDMRGGGFSIQRQGTLARVTFMSL